MTGPVVSLHTSTVSHEKTQKARAHLLALLMEPARWSDWPEPPAVRICLPVQCWHLHACFLGQPQKFELARRVQGTGSKHVLGEVPCCRIYIRLYGLYRAQVLENMCIRQ